MKNKLQSSHKILIIVIVGVLLAIVAAFGVVLMASKLISYGQGTTIAQQEQQQEEEVPPVTEEETVAKNRYSTDGFYEIGGVRYYFYGDHKGIPGVDVSSYQSNIDWEEVKRAGIEFAMIRVGYRGWSTGELDLDDNFTQHIQGALDAGLEVGVYFFSQALNVDEAVEEAQYTLEQIKDYNITYPVVFDWEEVESETARTNDMDMRQLTSCAEAFCRTVEEAGYEGGVYFNQAYGYEQFNLYSLQQYTLWLAEYAKTPSFDYHVQMWQYTNEGEIPGIEGNVDLNIMFKTK